MQKRAQTYFERGDLQNAFADYDTLIKRQPNAVAYYARGNAHLQRFIQNGDDHLTLALADLNEAIASEPRFARAYISRGLVHEHLGKHALATADYAHVLSLLTETIQTWTGDANVLIQVHYWCAFTYQKLGKTDKAVESIHAANRRVFSFFLEKIHKM